MNPDDATLIWFDTLEAVLNNGTLPGDSAHRLMAPDPRRMLPSGPESLVRRGGVLIMLYATAAGVSLPVTRRSQRVLHHKGQISLPGGLQEPEDGSLAETALRETNEEIGVNPNDIRLLGKLSTIYTVPSNSSVEPYVGCHSGVPVFSPNHDEVAEIIEFPLRVLLDPCYKGKEYREIAGRRVKVPFFRLGPHKVWGATAMILSEFAVILAATPELAHIPNHPRC